MPVSLDAYAGMPPPKGRGRLVDAGIERDHVTAPNPHGAVNVRASSDMPCFLIIPDARRQRAVAASVVVHDGVGQ